MSLYKQDTYPNDEIHPALETVTAQWLVQLERARQVKKKVFGKHALECMSFYSGPRDWDQMMGRDYIAPASYPELTFKMHVNLAFEFVTLFGPSLYYTNPVRTVKPRAPVQVPENFFPDPNTFVQLAMAEQQRVAVDGLRSILLEAYLNWTPSRYHLDKESRDAVDEALIKGRGLLFTDLVESPDQAFRAVVSRFDSVDHLLVDPDARSMADAKWIARRCVHPVWQVERDFGLKRGAVKGNLDSQALQADASVDADASARIQSGNGQDLLYYWQIWTKMGIGGRLPGINRNLRDPLDEIFGDYCYLAICNCARFPLNLPPDLTNDPDRYDDVLEAAKWPIPFYVDGRWPCVELDFHKIPDSPWPMAHLLSAMGEMKFLNWVMSFLVGHIKNASRDFVAVQKSLDDEIKTAIVSGSDLELIEIRKEHGRIDEAIAFLQHPPVNGDIWTFIKEVQENFKKRVGMSELLYGPDPDSSQPRSAAESNIRDQTAGIRPDDMARQVEAWQSEVAAQEAFASRFLLSGRDVSVCLGPLGSMAWDQFVFTADASQAFHELEYRIESGSTLRPNKAYEVRQMTEAATTLMPVFQTYGQATGDMRPLNNLIADFCKSRDLDPNRYQLSAAPMPPILPDTAPANPTPQGDVQIPPASGQPELG